MSVTITVTQLGKRIRVDTTDADISEVLTELAAIGKATVESFAPDAPDGDDETTDVDDDE